MKRPDVGLDNPAESHYNAPIGFEGESTAEAGAKRAAEGERQPPRTREHGPGAPAVKRRRQAPGGSHRYL